MRTPVGSHAGTSLLPIPGKNTLWDKVLELGGALLKSGVLLGKEGGDQQVEMMKTAFLENAKRRNTQASNPGGVGVGKLRPRLVLALCSSQQRLEMRIKWSGLISPAQEQGRGHTGWWLIGHIPSERQQTPPPWWGGGSPIPPAQKPHTPAVPPQQGRKELCTP